MHDDFKLKQKILLASMVYVQLYQRFKYKGISTGVYSALLNTASYLYPDTLITTDD